MNEQILEKEKMDSIKALSDVNIKISEARNVLFKLQEEETEYLVKREEKVLGKINKVFEESRDLLYETHKNYEEVHEFCQTISNYSDFVSESYKKLQNLLELFKNKNKLWEENVNKINIELAHQRKLIENDTKAIKERENRMDEESKGLKAQREHIESQQVTLSISYNLEKELFEKITKK